jgi:hypothetical protein
MFGKHRKSESSSSNSEPSWGSKTPARKAAEFDASHASSKQRAEGRDKPAEVKGHDQSADYGDVSPVRSSIPRRW